MNRKLRAFCLLLAAASLFMSAAALLAWPRDAFAAGTVQIMTPGPTERDNGSWLIRVRITLPKEPSHATIPFRATFSKVVYYERAIVKKGEPPVLNPLRLDPPKKSVVRYDVKFSDTMGNVHNATVFEFEVKREGGFDAGEYTVQLSNDDGNIGNAFNLTLKGDNEPVDRTAMSFATSEPAAKPDAGRSADESGTVPTAVNATGSAAPMIPSSAYDEEVKERPKGCGCAVLGVDGAALAWGAPIASIFALALVGARRGRGRRRRRSVRSTP